MFDLQTMLNNAMAARRAEQMKTSPQLTLGELILRLEAIQNKDLPVVFDAGGVKPTSIGSWRGSYCELAIAYDKSEGYSGYNSDVVEWESKDGEYKTYRRVPTTLPDEPKVADLLEMLRKCLSQTFEGYKGGDFTMGKTTPVWVANYGTSSGFQSEEGKDCQAIVSVRETESAVILETAAMDY